jgi:heme/copper-type cytochrome/quinol oxidase subunit 2
MEQPSNTSLFDLHLDQSSIDYLNETARWSRLLSIIGFIYCGFMVIIGLFFGSMMSRLMSGMGGETAMPAMSGVFFSFFFILMSLILFFPSYYLFNFSSKMRRAIRNNEQDSLTDSLKNLKSFFKFYGIVVIIVLSFYALVIIATVIGAMVGSRH